MTKRGGRQIWINDEEFDYILRHAEARNFSRVMTAKPDDEKVVARLWVHFDNLRRRQALTEGGPA